MSASLISMVGEYLFSQKVREEQRLTEDLAGTMASGLYNLDAEALYQLSLQNSAPPSERVMVLDMHGVVQADALCEYNGQRLSLYEVREVLLGNGSTYGFYNTQTSGARMWQQVQGRLQNASSMLGVYAAPIYREADMIGVLVYMSDSREVYDSLTQMQAQIAIWLVLVALAVLMLSTIISRFFTRPIEELSQGIKRMTAGDFKSRVNVRGKNEFAQLAEAFNMMCQRLESLDQTRNQFVSNASHELKTPLSAMKILIETLLYQDNPDEHMLKEFLTDINGEIDRLNLIVGDLLTLVHIDSGRLQLKPEPLSLDELILDTVHRLRPLADHRDISIECAIRDKIETTGDAQKLGQVFYNLIDNAIKYTPEGGRVVVDVSRTGRSAIVKVTDTGIGIPKVDLLHVFDRFYRVDKARARATGGTGLGLSIVKQIVMLHEGTISVTSEEEKGSTFTVELPIVNIV